MTPDSSLADELEYTFSEACDVGPVDQETVMTSPLQYKMVYHNHLGEDVIVVDRSGVPMLIKSAPGKSGGFIVEKVYQVGSRVIVDPNGISRHNGGPSEERKIYNNQVNEVNAQVGAMRRMGVRYEISRDKVVGGESPLYIPEVDIVLGIERQHDVRKIVHPYSDPATVFKLLERDVTTTNKPMFRYQIFIISNDRTHGDRYINILGDVYKVPSISNKSLQDGVYICSSGTVSRADGGVPKNFTTYTYDQAKESIMMYESIEEAKTFGDPHGEREREFKRSEAQLKEDKLKLERDLTEQKLKRDEAMSEREDVLAQLEHYRKMKELRDKDYYDDRSRVRKDNSEIVKYVPAMITGALAVVALAVKLSNK